MKNLKEQNPLVLAFAIIGVCALIYGGWTIYEHHVETEQAQQFFGAPATGPMSGLYQPSTKPPPQ